MTDPGTGPSSLAVSLVSGGPFGQGAHSLTARSNLRASKQWARLLGDGQKYSRWRARSWGLTGILPNKFRAAYVGDRAMHASASLEERHGRTVRPCGTSALWHAPASRSRRPIRRNAQAGKGRAPPPNPYPAPPAPEL